MFTRVSLQRLRSHRAATRNTESQAGCDGSLKHKAEYTELRRLRRAGQELRTLGLRRLAAKQHLWAGVGWGRKEGPW